MTMTSWSEVCEGFVEAARWFVRTTSACDPDGRSTRWGDPALGEWSVRDLVGHTSRALMTVEKYLADPAAAVEVASPGRYFELMLAGTGDDAAVAQRGRDAGAALGTDPAAAIAELAERVIALVGRCAGEEIAATSAGGMTLFAYLPTRTFELTVHTADLARALSLPLDVPPHAAAQTLAVFGELAVWGGQVGQLLLAATGRTALPPGFSVIPV